MNFLKLFFCVLLIAGCGKKEDSTAKSEDHSELKKSIVETYAKIVFANYEDSYNLALALQKSIESFTAAPSAEGFEACKKAWLAAREPYGLTEAFRFAGGPIDDEDGPEGNINAWPLDENYIDYVRGAESAGIINNTETYPEITKSVLADLNEKGGETNISIGFHAIEFLLWGQDDLDTKLKTPGKRPYTDYLANGGTAKNQKRRAEYLNVIAEILVEDLKSMVDEWNPEGKGNYREAFLALETDKALSNILTGIGTLSKAELAGERIFVALDNQDQEDEHSCFSDNTHRDIILNAEGIQNVIAGEYKRLDGTVVKGASLLDLLKKVDSKLYAELEEISKKTVENTKAIPVPFDFALTQEKVGGQGPIMLSVLSLQKQGNKLTEAALALGITIGTDLPE